MYTALATTGLPVHWSTQWGAFSKHRIYPKPDTETRTQLKQELKPTTLHYLVTQQNELLVRWEQMSQYVLTFLNWCS